MPIRDKVRLEMDENPLPHTVALKAARRIEVSLARQPPGSIVTGRAGRRSGKSLRGISTRRRQRAGLELLNLYEVNKCMDGAPDWEY
jgi:hypothetical protein